MLGVVGSGVASSVQKPRLSVHLASHTGLMFVCDL